MGKVFGLIGLLLGIASLILLWVYFPLYMIALPILAIIFGGIGIAKDDSKAMGVVGLILGIVTLVLWFILPLLLLGFIFGSLL